MTDIHCPDDSLKMLRETLCVAQSALHHTIIAAQRELEHCDRLQRLIDDIDRQRPLGPDGKHGNRHTKTCGCDDVQPAAVATDEAAVERAARAIWDAARGPGSTPWEDHVPTVRDMYRRYARAALGAAGGAQ